MRSSTKIAILAISLSLILGMAAVSGYEFGSKVEATDDDIGNPLFAMPAKTTITYWDIGVPGYDEEDVVYLHTPGVCVNANDIRLTPFDTFIAGSKVMSTDKDIGMPLTMFSGLAIRYLDLYGSANYDLKDPVYIHSSLTSNPPSALATITNDVRLSNIEGFPAGTKVMDFNPDHNKFFGMAPPGLAPVGFFDVNGNGVYDYPDNVYLNYPSGFPKYSVAVNNIRLSVYSA
jgi:hypothetical protein